MDLDDTAINYNLYCTSIREFPCKGLAAILEVALNSVQYLLG